MTAPTVFAAVSTTPQAHHLAAAEVYVRACHADQHLTHGRVAELAHTLASRPEWQAAIDSDRADLLQRIARLEAENRALRDANRHQSRVIVGGIAALRNARNTDRPGWASVAVLNALLALETSSDATT